MIDQEKLTLELGLLCWYEFYQKCHELENNILIKDYKLSLCSNIKSSKYSGDITERELTWKDTYFSYNYENKILPKFNNYFEEKYHFDQLYENYKEEITLQNKYYKSKIETLYSQEIYYSKEEKLKNKIGWTTAIVIFVILDIIWLFGMGVLKNNINDDALLFTKIIGIPLGAAFFSVPVAIISAIILGITKLITGIVIKNKNKTIENQIQLNESYIERIQDKYSWIKSLNNGDDYAKYLKDLELLGQEYDGWIKTEKLKIETEVNNLKVLKNKLGKIFPLPYKYSEEYVVTSLLSLLLDGRSDTLKEAINLLEEERSRDKNLTNLNLLERNLEELKRLVLTYKGELINFQPNNIELYNIYDEINNYKFKEKYFYPDNFEFDFDKQEDKKEFSKN